MASFAIWSMALASDELSVPWRPLAVISQMPSPLGLVLSSIQWESWVVCHSNRRLNSTMYCRGNVKAEAIIKQDAHVTT